MDSLRRIWFTWRRFEYWPWWFFYVPLLPWYLYYAVRARSFTWFTAANPGIADGGFFGEEKRKILACIPLEYKPATHEFLVDERELWNKRVAELPETLFPCIFKPDVGERGSEVKRIGNNRELLDMIGKVEKNWILQAYVDFPLELGVYFARDPENGKGRVISLTKKKFLQVSGDGKRNVNELLRESDRGFLQIKRLRKEHPGRLELVPKHGQTLVVEALGNHCLGTEFIDAREYLCEELDLVFERIVQDFPGFHIGRFDLRVPDFESLIRGEQIRIFELNGVSSEPAHIYDHRISVWGAYREVLQFWNLIYRISLSNHKKGAPFTKTSELLRRFLKHHLSAD